MQLINRAVIAMVFMSQKNSSPIGTSPYFTRGATLFGCNATPSFRLACVGACHPVYLPRLTAAFFGRPHGSSFDHHVPGFHHPRSLTAAIYSSSASWAYALCSIVHKLKLGVKDLSDFAADAECTRYVHIWHRGKAKASRAQAPKHTSSTDSFGLFTRVNTCPWSDAGTNRAGAEAGHCFARPGPTLRPRPTVKKTG